MPHKYMSTRLRLCGARCACYAHVTAGGRGNYQRLDKNLTDATKLTFCLNSGQPDFCPGTHCRFGEDLLYGYRTTCYYLVLQSMSHDVFKWPDASVHLEYKESRLQ